MSYPAPLTVLRTLGLVLTGRIGFPKTLAGRMVTRRDGKRFVIFRQAVAAPGPAPEGEKAAVLCFRFRFAAGTPALNRRLSLIPIPLIVGYPGFRTKIWSLNDETGAFIGLYEWDSMADLEGYLGSLAIRLMKKARRAGHGRANDHAGHHGRGGAEKVRRCLQACASARLDLDRQMGQAMNMRQPVAIGGNRLRRVGTAAR